jgi:AcrR family transcriptional regulator
VDRLGRGLDDFVDCRRRVAMGASGEPRRTGARLHREAYFNAAFKILDTVGFQDLSVDTLCAELGVTRGSFYHHFASWPEFVEALMEAWEHTVAELLDRWVSIDPMVALGEGLAVISRYPIQAESAIRAWGWANPTVAQAARRWDLAREAFGRDWFETFVHDPERARVLAHMATAMVVGMLNLQRPMDLDLVMKVLGEFMRCVLGIEFVPDATGWFVARYPTDEPA